MGNPRPAPTVFRGGLVLAPDESGALTPRRADVRVEDATIAEVGVIEVARGDEVIEAAGKLIMPGLINGHFHSWEALLKGRYDNMPLEIWMLYAYPLADYPALSSRLIYLRTLLNAAEALKSGVTSVVDDVVELPGLFSSAGQDMDSLAAVFDAYQTIGIRATCSGHVLDRSLLDTMPYVDELLPPKLVAHARMFEPPSVSQYLDFSREAIRRFHGRAGRLRYMVAPSGPQRCSDELLTRAHALAAEHDLAYHLHLLETRLQGQVGALQLGKSLVQHLHDLGVLDERATFAHGIWVSESDMELLGGAGCSVIHNAISNLKLGAGIAPLRALLAAGVNVGLGTDGCGSNDTPRLFDVMRVAGLVHKLETPDYEKWPSAHDILFAATRGSAMSARMGEVTGSIEVGKAADLVLVDLGTLSFTPCNDIVRQLVYCENGSSVRAVMVDGRLLVRDGILLTIDEADLLAELREHLEDYWRRHGEAVRISRAFEPAFAAIHARASAWSPGNPPTGHPVQ